MAQMGGNARRLRAAVVLVGLQAACMGQISENSTGRNTGGSGGSSSTGSGSGGAIAVTGDTGLPCDVQNVLSARCWSCHTPATVLPGQPVLVTRADLMAASSANPAVTNAQEAVARMQNTTAPMPPAPQRRPRRRTSRR